MIDHTPGSWSFSRRSWKGEWDTHGNYYVVGDIHEPEQGVCEGYSVSVAQVVGTATSGDIPLANARLVAAAPELLEACQRLVAHLDHVRELVGNLQAREYKQSAAYLNAVAVIAKATGQP
jgi:hypothetical protein